MNKRLLPPQPASPPAPLTALYRTLLRKMGPQFWWPGKTPLEVCIGAILTQNTAWTNVERAIMQLKRAKLLSLSGLRRVSESRLAELVRPSGYFHQKAKKLKAFIAYLDHYYGGSLRACLARPLRPLRKELLAVHGIGPETADSILLYAAQKPIFVIDAYTRRILRRHAHPVAGRGYETLRLYVESKLPRSVKKYNEFHALLVRTGKEFCRKRKPLCTLCPLQRHGPLIVETES